MFGNMGDMSKMLEGMQENASKLQAELESKTFNVTTSNLGLDNPVINRVIVKPNEKKISSEYQKRTKIYKKYARSPSISQK